MWNHTIYNTLNKKTNVVRNDDLNRYVFVDYELIKRELKTRLIFADRYDERLKN